MLRAGLNRVSLNHFVFDWKLKAKDGVKFHELLLKN